MFEVFESGLSRVEPPNLRNLQPAALEGFWASNPGVDSLLRSASWPTKS